MFVDSWKAPADHANGFASSRFQIAFITAFVGLLPLMALNILLYSQQLQAADLFRAAPIHGPAAICNGARRAVHLLLTFPLLLVLGIGTLFIAPSVDDILMLATGLITAPVFALLPHLLGTAVPLSTPSEEA